MKIIQPLTSLRFFAIFAVFLVHLDFFFYKFQGGALFYNRYFTKGYIGVTFFFVLSGFLLTYRYYDRFKKSISLSLKKFFVSRISRIYPLHIIVLLVSLPLPVDYIANNYIAQRFLANFFLVHSFVPRMDFYFSFGGVAWFLSDLMFATLLFPLILYILFKMKLNSFFKSIVLLIIVWIIGLVLITINKQNSNSYWLFYVSPYFRLIDFVCGVLLGFAFLHMPKYKKAVSHKIYTFLEFCSITLLFGLMYFAPATVKPESYYSSLYYIPAVAFMVYLFAQTKGYISRSLENHFWVGLGEISFPFFLFHLIVIRYLLLDFYYLSYMGPFFLSIFAFIMTLFISYFYHKYLETTVKELFIKLIQKPFFNKNN